MLLLWDPSKKWLHYSLKIILLLLLLSSNEVQVLQLYSLEVMGFLAVEILEDPEPPKQYIKEGFFIKIYEVKDREVSVWAEVFANEDVAKGLVKRNVKTG